jgi:hypothetical protein
MKSLSDAAWSKLLPPLLPLLLPLLDTPRVRNDGLGLLPRPGPVGEESTLLCSPAYVYNAP